MAGGKASIPLAGTAVYMTSYPRLGRSWEKFLEDRGWLYQTPLDILIKASNGASDFGNKFGQPLICGSVLTFEHMEEGKQCGYDKVIMLAGGIGFGRLDSSKKDKPQKGDKIVVLGGDNYRIGMGGGAVSSVATGEYNNSIELNAVQRSNPEMQKRVFNAIRAMSELKKNPIVAIHDHGAGGHLNCLSELLEESGGKIDVRKLPIGDPTLSAKEIIGNESQERMGLIIHKWDLEKIWDVAARERAPLYVVGEVTDDQRLHFYYGINGSPVDLKVDHMFGSSPKTIIEDKTINIAFAELQYEMGKIPQYLDAVLKLESVACKDWLTNKVDRSVTGKVVKQQTTGTIQLPLNNVGVMAIDYLGEKGIATAIGHAPVSALIDPVAGSRLSIAESITNILWAPIQDGLEGLSLSANWMWPAKNPGEDARLYKAVEACSDFAIQLGVNIPTGKDSLSMTQKYPDGSVVYSPGTVIISAVGEVSDINKVVEPALVNDQDSTLIYLDFSSDVYKLGGSSFAQIINKVGEETPTVKNPGYFKHAFTAIQELIKKDLILAGHDISAGGMVVTLIEMCFPTPGVGLDIDFRHIVDTDMVKILFSENPGVVIQVKDINTVESIFKKYHLSFKVLGTPTNDRQLSVRQFENRFSFDIDKLRDSWFETSYLMDIHQCGSRHAKSRFKNYKEQPLEFSFPSSFTGKLNQYNIDQRRKGKTGIKAAIIREKGVNGDREMAYAMHLAGFDVKDVHMTDLIWGEENLEDINFLVFVGGFSNSDVLGSAKGWAGAFLYNHMAKKALDNFYARDDTLSLGVCNGCQLMMELGLVYPEHKKQPKLLHNKSGKFESAFINVTIPENNSVMLGSLAGTRLGIHLAHGEGRFKFPLKEDQYYVSGKFSYQAYPGNPNGSDYAISSVHSADGRHLVMMPHLERSIFPWNWANYPQDRKEDEVSPWIEAFVNARLWVEEW